MLEFISILPDPPNPSFNGSYKEWKSSLQNLRRAKATRLHSADEI